MKVIFDTNIYISWIRSKEYSDLMLDQYTQKYMSAIVLTELWAGAKSKQAGRIIEKLQSSYIKADRIIPLSFNDSIKAGQIISDFPENLKNKIKTAGFIHDIYVSLTAISIGAALYTENKSDFELIKEYLPKLKVNFL